jgi:UDPglucose 6-dehydrogenase
VPEKPPIGVIGVGWVGLVSAACFAELGHEVWCRDIDLEKIGVLKRGEVPIFEPGLHELVKRNSPRLHFVGELAPVLEHARLLFVCVDTPPTYSGDADLSRVEAVVNEVPNSSEHAIVMKSTVPVRTGANVVRRLAELGKPELGYASNPEFLREGSAVDDFLNPDRVVVGSDSRTPWVGAAVAQLYEPLKCPIVQTDVPSAEMIKLASNAFLATKISFINEIANVCEEVGADVSEVAGGMGLDPRIGQSFLNAGIGYGGSCLAGDETVLVRVREQTRLVSLETLYREHESQAIIDSQGAALASPRDLEVLSWREGAAAPGFLPVAAITRRPFDGEIVEVRTKMGRRVRATPDHPFVVSGSSGADIRVKQVKELTAADWVPIAQNAPPAAVTTPEHLNPLSAAEPAGLGPGDLIVRPERSEIAALASRPVAERTAALEHPRGSRIRLYDVVRSGALRLHEAQSLGLSLEGAAVGTARNGTYIPVSILADEAFWRIVGLYIAEGHCTVDGRRHRLQWSFHPTDEEDLVQEVAGFWLRLGVKAAVFKRPTTTCVTVSSRVLAAWWLEALGLGRNCYEQRIPDLAWTQSEPHKRALLAGLWLGDGSWSYVATGPSVVLEYGTASRELIDGILRLLGDLGVVARLKVGRTARSTRDNYWIVVSGADQVEGLLDLVPERDRRLIRDSLERQAKRIAPTGYRRHSKNAVWARVTRIDRQPFRDFVYSLEVPHSGTFVTTGGLVVHNCFPKDVSALKQLAGNSGYHFQLLNAVIEVNELQKRRVVSKLKRHLGSLIGKRIALLGLAFKPNTDDMREASSVVLAARLQAEGAVVCAYDPVAEGSASGLMTGVEMCDSALDCVKGANAAVIVTEWPEFGELDLAELKARMATPVVVDGRNVLNAEHARAAGLIYEGIGRS